MPPIADPATVAAKEFDREASVTMAVYVIKNCFYTKEHALIVTDCANEWLCPLGKFLKSQPFFASSSSSFSLNGRTMPWPVETGEKPNIW